MADEEEYEIESILEARVENTSRQGRKPKLRWKFRVRWKGYTREDDTWEPIENLTGSEETLEHFWHRANTNGRNFRNLKQFKEGEVFMPVGPPKKQKGKYKEQPLGGDVAQEAVNGSSRSPQQSSSRVRKRGDNDGETDEDHSPKRPRSALQQFSSKPNLLLTEAGSPGKVKPADVFLREKPLREQPSDDGPQLDTEAELPIPAKDSSLATKEPSPPTEHVQSTASPRPTRYVNPLVQILKDFHASNADHESNKSNETPPLAPSKARRRSKPGPGRSSAGLLIQSTSQRQNREKSRSNGSRKSVMRDRSIDEVAEMDLDVKTPSNPAVSQDLSQPDDLSFNSTALPDPRSEKTSSTKVPMLEPGKGTLNSTIGNSLFPATIGNIKNILWTRSTIFGPLGLGSDVSPHVANEDCDDPSIPFQVNLDSSISMPIVLVDVISSTFPKSTLSRHGPPGKFYRGSFAVELLRTLRTQGSFARATLSPEATEADRLNFRHFMKRLLGEELFLAPVNGDLLVFCSSSNALSTQRLEIPSNLTSVEGVLASYVSIENYSDFASAANHADNVMWSQYILTVSDDAL